MEDFLAMFVFILYLSFILFCLLIIRGIIRNIKEKDIGGLVISLLVFLFVFSFFIGALSGGSALHNAANDYELYQTGHYYLVSHGVWTEVSYERYLFVLISEIVGILTFVPAFVLCIFRAINPKDI